VNLTKSYDPSMTVVASLVSLVLVALSSLALGLHVVHTPLWQSLVHLLTLVR
jgi:hypothetical protein